MSFSKTSLKKVKISVAIVFYNPTKDDEKQTLENIERLNSIDSFDFSFYLIDNASPNRKLNIKLPVRIKNVYIKYLEKNKGFGAGHNSILEDINSDFHIIMNPDIDIEDLDGFIKAIYYMQGHKNIVMLSPLVRNETDGNIQYLNRKIPTVFDLFIRFLGPNFFSKRQASFTKKANGYNHIQLAENATGSFMMIRTYALKKIQGFDTSYFMYFEDTDLTRRISIEGKVIFFPYLTVIHGWRRENHTLRGLKPMIISMVKYFNKWGWKWI